MRKAQPIKLQQQSSDHILLVEPVCFYPNPETMTTNSHQTPAQLPQSLIQEQAVAEHRAFREMLENHHIKTTLFQGTFDCPDALFCNNWVSTHEDRTYNLYPVLAPNRRLERRPDIITFLESRYQLNHDFTGYEAKGQFLESTGSFVLDRIHHVAYAVRSPRTDSGLFKAWCELMGYEAILFDAYDSYGKSEYHANVVMFIGTQVAAVCAQSIPEPQRAWVLDKLGQTHKIIEISSEQSKHFCGNVLEVRSVADQKVFVVMSSCAYKAYTQAQKEIFGAFYDGILHTELGMIEKYGGGSARCMMLELF